MAIHSVEVWQKGLAAAGVSPDFGRANAWVLFDTNGSEICAGFASEPFDAPVN